MKRGAALLLAVALLLTGCQGNAPGSQALVVVSAPVTAHPWIGQFLERGARLAANSSDRVRIEVKDNAGSAQQAVAIARQAVSDGAVALVTDGVGARAVAQVTDRAHLAVLIAFEGGASLIDPRAAPTLFRMAPANSAMCRRLADYLADIRPHEKVAVLSDDSSYGREGATQSHRDLAHDELPVVYDRAFTQQDVSVQVLAARRSGAASLVVWAQAAGVAAVLRSARSSGWQVPVFAGPTGEDPLVRQQLADHPEWVEGLTFASFRITSETGPEPFAAYRTIYEKAYGPDKIGVGDVVQPPDWSTYAFDSINLVEAALERDPKHVLDALQQVSITGANGDERGFGPDDREGVSPDDIYFARFHAMRFAPVKDDKLSTNLPVVPQ